MNVIKELCERFAKAYAAQTERLLLGEGDDVPLETLPANEDAIIDAGPPDEPILVESQRWLRHFIEHPVA